MALLTLAESAKYYNNPLQRGIVETFVRSSGVLQYLPFMSIKGNAFKYNVEETLPGVGFRSINEEYTPDIGVINPVVESLFIAGGEIKIDNALIRQQGEGADILAEQISMKTKALALAIEDAFFHGDTTADPEKFDGLEVRVTGDQLLKTGTTAGGAALTLAMLDELIDACDLPPSVLFMNKTLRRKVNALMRAAGQAAETVTGVFGQQIPAYAGVPIVVVGKNNTGAEILGFTEADGQSTPAAASCTSVYAVSFGGEGITGLQSGPMDVDDQGRRSTFRHIVVDWDMGLKIAHPRAVARLKAIKNA
ncbi:major capsid protein [Desulfolutivibrio sp.]|uniref:major capsid protein n=1 Tax=Desulfolutivibrio sp. TaxID=2773296 RepID=UPI002F9621C2